MEMKKLKVVLDADDVLLDCNGYALRLLSQEEGVQYGLDEVTGWGTLGKDVDRRFKFFSDPGFYSSQPALPGAGEFLMQMMDVAEVMIMTAVYPQFMGERIRRLMELFPKFPADHIIMGTRKDVVHADVMLDDGVHNLLHSNCTLPVIFRRPWNHGATGVCSVRDYGEFLTLMGFLTGKKQDKSLLPKAVCIVGPSGSGKHKLAGTLCKMDGFQEIRTYTTFGPAAGHSKVVSTESFNAMERAGEFLETTYYGGEQYGIRRKDIASALAHGLHAVAVMDISGCMAVYNGYPGRCKIVFADAEKRSCVLSILSKGWLTKEQAADRIVAIGLEQKNKVLADVVVPIGEGTDYVKEAAAVARICV